MLKTLKQKVNPKHVALLVVDVQNDFCHSDGVLAKQGINLTYRQAMVPRLMKFILQARRKKVPIIFIQQTLNRWTVSPAYREKRLESFLGLAQEGTWGADFYILMPEPNDYVLTKHRPSAFESTELDLILRIKGIKTVILTGVATNVCVESTARDAFMKDYYVVVVKDCTASGRLRSHNATLQNIEGYFGTVATSQEIVAAWRS